ncbi:uncharacterized protein TrAtP1_006907 [Trichoderma atroviride]|uniref:Uncharacterized protein n=1 Tax=Hypocrea atroviridis (strain ATCC 20476 / IMI 206040) TaxID=452589 RepID=G9PB50_HYPAI|nr:uncharacterized protein TRIATDRAFT_302949 [Trichoderma atroviride IMI 206040]EHK39600.1 hypothetical protein TRIATDRAFT_302949 [Trichoderma atroviride IMI 206040]UKZ65713.1 hypothetical protein TrAtP1_006907 [Trichoderma atroviride]
MKLLAISHHQGIPKERKKLPTKFQSVKKMEYRHGRDGVPLRIKNGPHRVTKLAPGNRITIDLDNKSSAPDTTAGRHDNVHLPSISIQRRHPNPAAFQHGLISSSIGARDARLGFDSAS